MKSNQNQAGAASQRGAVLIIALIMLVAMALLAVTAFNSSTLNLRVVANTQLRQEAVAAVQTAIERTISSPQFSTNAAAVAASPIPVDVNGDGNTDYTVSLSPVPKCYKYRVLKNSELDLAAPLVRDKRCQRPANENFGLDDDRAGATTAADSLCADSEWNVRGVVTDASTNVSVAVNQGVALRVATTDAANGCL